MCFDFEAKLCTTYGSDSQPGYCGTQGYRELVTGVSPSIFNIKQGRVQQIKEGWETLTHSILCTLKTSELNLLTFDAIFTRSSRNA